MTLKDLTIKAVDRRLKKFRGNRRMTAESLGVSTRIVRIWIYKHESLAHWRRGDG